MPMMTQAAYAKHRGVSPQAVNKAIKAGRIHLVDGKVDAATADREWESASRARVASEADSIAKRPTVAEASGYHQERAQREREEARRIRAEADLAEMKAAEMAKQLVRADDVQRAWAALANDVRTAMLQLSARLAPVLVGRDQAFIRKTLETEIRAALSSVAEVA